MKRTKQITNLNLLNNCNHDLKALNKKIFSLIHISLSLYKKGGIH